MVAGLLAGWLAGWLTSLLASSIACLLPCWLACLHAKRFLLWLTCMAGLLACPLAPLLAGWLACLLVGWLGWLGWLGWPGWLACLPACLLGRLLPCSVAQLLACLPAGFIVKGWSGKKILGEGEKIKIVRHQESWLSSPNTAHLCYHFITFQYINIDKCYEPSWEHTWNSDCWLRRASTGSGSFLFLEGSVGIPEDKAKATENRVRLGSRNHRIAN